MASRTTTAKRRRTNGTIAQDPDETATTASTNGMTPYAQSSTSGPVPSTTASQPRTATSSTAHLPATSTDHNNLMGSTSTASGLRRSARNLRSINEVVGGKMQEVFVIDDEDDDEEAPPSRPLAADLPNGNHHGPTSGLTRLNGGAVASASGTKGKRKAQPSPLPPASSTYDSASSSTAAAKKRKKDVAAAAAAVQAAAREANGTAGAGTAPLQHGTAYTNDYAASSNNWNGAQDQRQHQIIPDWSQAQTQQQQQQQQQQQPASSYRGGYAAGTGAMAPMTSSTTNGHHPPLANRQHILDSAESAQKRFMYERQYQQPPQPPSSSTSAVYRTDSQQQAVAAPLPVDDKDGHFIVREGEWISDPRGGEQRYKILSQLGQGTFGKVVECYDRHTRSYVAIKVIRAIQKYRDASQIEIRVLRTLSEHDPANDNKCIHLLDTFSYRNHVCIVSQLLDKSVFDFLRDNQFNPFPPAHIWSFAQQLLKSVAFLHRLNLVHTDLKPENILLVHSEFDWQPVSRRSNSRRKRVLQDTDIRLIDFGSATFNDEYHSQVVSTRHYRAPEIILNMGWSFPCDAWSIGCILVEFYTGEALFQTHDNLEHLAMMEQVLGPMPDAFRRKAETYKAEYFRGGRLDFPNADTPKSSKKYVSGMRKIGEILSKATTWKKHNERFLHLLKRLLDFDPTKRIRVDEALRHPYFDLLPNEIPP